MIVWLIMVMSGIMEKSGHMKRLVSSFTSLTKDARVVGTVMSALIGLLPMPGGALFSAPLVGEALLQGQCKSRTQNRPELLVQAYMGILVAAVSGRHPGHSVAQYPDLAGT